MIAITISFISGILAAHFSLYFPVSIITLCVVVIVSLFIKYRVSKQLPGLFFIISVFIFGIVYSLIRQETIPEPELPDAEVSVEGDIIDVPELSNGRVRFTVDQVSIGGKKVPGKVRLFLPEQGTINKHALSAGGERIRAAAKLRAPKVLHNPGVYAYDLKKEGIAAVGYAKSLQVIGEIRSLPAWINQKRLQLGDIIENSLSPENAALHKAIIPGLTGGISREMRDAFSATGLAHLLSISGAHFGLLAFIIFRAVKLIIRCLPEKTLAMMTLYITPSQIAVLMTLPVLIFYALISGMSTPVIRSLIMISIYMLALYLGRSNQWLNSLSTAAFIILLLQPAALFDLSFQLSFIAVLFIGYIAGKKKEHRAKNTEQRQGSLKNIIFQKLKDGILMTTAAVCGTAPLIAISFKQFPLISPVANLIVTPFVCFIILPLGFFASFTAFIFQMTSMPFSGLLNALTHSGLWMIKIFSRIPYANLHVHNPSIAMVALYYFSLVFFIRYRFNRRGGRPSSLASCLPFIVTICLYLTSPFFSGNEFQATFLDVGQGDSSVVRLPDRKTMLIDGGLREPDMGRNVVAPYLWSQGIKNIDYLVLTHSDSDHYGGLLYIMDNFSVGEIWLNGIRTAGSEEFFNKIAEKKIPFRILRRGDVLQAKRYRICALHPYDEFVSGPLRGASSAENSASLVLKIESGRASVLFTGDIETGAEESLIPLGGRLKSDIIKVPHHGGRTSSSADFIKAVAPRIAVVSAGKNNSFDHPHKETVERYKNAGARLYRTDIDGAVSFSIGGSGFKPDPLVPTCYWDNEFKEVEALGDETRNLRALFFRFP
ncbi:MAG: DNA internalization-related competence protein ComEC/Rec2 [Nitrospiraceae bacterium]|nr:MAG: DNA internalization-related competence protein ComEC/Rec2 [Nitrospiraceae bacterium]